MTAGVTDLSIEQSATFSRAATFVDSGGTPLNFTGWTFQGQIRRTYASEVILATFVLTTNTPASDGVLNILLSSGVTAAIPVNVPEDFDSDNTQYVYDIYGTDPTGFKERILEGFVFVSPGVTR